MEAKSYISTFWTNSTKKRKTYDAPLLSSFFSLWKVAICFFEVLIGHVLVYTRPFQPLT